jgi:hypothetical protein
MHNGLPVSQQQQQPTPNHNLQNSSNPPPTIPHAGSIAAGPQPPMPNTHAQHPPRVTMMTSTFNFHNPAQRPASAPGQRVPTGPQPPSHPPLPPQPQLQQHNVPGAAPFFPALHLPHLPAFPLPGPFAQPRVNHMQPTNTTAWLLSSPTGPQGFLFAPGHGYFSSLSPATSAAQQEPYQHHGSAVSQGNQRADTTTATVPHAELANDQPRNDAQGAVVRANQPLPGPALAQAEQNGQDNDLFAFIINRGWLFLRLYLFMFVFSEPGTWKRWLMIVAAAIICLQPRNGPFTRLMTAARGHFDNLVGPPAQQPRAGDPARPNANAGDPLQPAGPRNDATAQRPANVRGAVQMTPEEAAARILTEQRNQQNLRPRFWRDTFYRLEQSIALFLASLVPGVGERHVRAREETRREERRQEDERRRAAEEVAAAAAAATANDETTEQPSSPTANGSVLSGGQNADVGNTGPSTSSSVQVRSNDTGETELRNRA